MCNSDDLPICDCGHVMVPVDWQLAFVGPEGKVTAVVMYIINKAGEMEELIWALDDEARLQVPSLRMETLGETIQLMEITGQLLPFYPWARSLTGLYQIEDHRTDHEEYSSMLWLGGSDGTYPTPVRNQVYHLRAKGFTSQERNLNEVVAMLNSTKALRIKNTSGFTQSDQIDGEVFGRAFGDHRRIIVYDLAAISRSGQQ